MNDILWISNMFFSGKIPFNRKLHENEVKRLIEQSKNYWTIVNEDKCPTILLTKENEGSKKKSVVFLWLSGSLNITGVTTREEAENLYNTVMADLEKFCKGVFK